MGGDPLRVNEFSEHGPFRIGLAQLEGDLKTDLPPEVEAAIIDRYEARSEMKVVPGTPAEQQLGETLIRYANDLMGSPKDVPGDLDEWLGDVDNLPAGSPPKVRFMLPYEYMNLSSRLTDPVLASKAGRIAIAVEMNKFNGYQMSNLKTILDLFNRPDKVAMAASLLGLIQVSPDFEPAVPLGFDVLVRRANETATIEVKAWQRRLQWILGVAGEPGGFLGQRILNEVIEASSSKTYNLKFLYQLLFRQSIGQHLRYTGRRDPESWNLLIKLSSLRYRSMLVLLRNGQTEIVERFLNVLKVWQGPPHGIVDVFVHAAASVSPTDGRRMGYVFDMLRIIERQAGVVEDLTNGFTEDPERWRGALRKMESRADAAMFYGGVSGEDSDLWEELGRMAEQQVTPVARYVDRLEVLNEARFAWLENNSAASLANDFYVKLKQLLKTPRGSDPSGSGSGRAPAASSPSAPPAQSGGHAASAITDADAEVIADSEAIEEYYDDEDVEDAESAEDWSGEEAGTFDFGVAPVEMGGMSVFEAFPI